MTVHFGQRIVGDGQPCFITYEAGPTHDSLASAKRLVKLAADAGADAVKFQIFDPDRLVADKAMLFSYEVLVDRASGEQLPDPVITIASPAPNGSLRIRLPDSVRSGIYYLRALNGHGEAAAQSVEFHIS